MKFFVNLITAVSLVTAVSLAMPSIAQDRSKDARAQGINGKTMESCKADIQKYCNDANLKQECLVARWPHISNDCQDALATPMRGSGEGG